MDTRLIPQADSLPRLRDFVAFIEQRGPMSAADAGRGVGLEPRHALYYRDAAECLGLVKVVGKSVEATESARALLSTPTASPEEARVFRRLISESPTLQLVAPGLLSESSPSKDDLAVKIAHERWLSPSSAKRRAASLWRWRAQILERERQKGAQLGLSFGESAAIETSPPSSVLPVPEARSTRSSPSGRLLSVSLEGFKGFEQANLELAGLTVIVGTNASGKSNLRDAFRFLHGVGRGYSIAEIIGEKWVEGGVLQWKGIRGGTREATYLGRSSFALEAALQLQDGKRTRRATYRIEVCVPPVEAGTPPRVVAERLVVDGRGQFVFDSHPDNNPPPQADPLHLSIRLKKPPGKGFVGKSISVLSALPAITQVLTHREVKATTEVRELSELVLDVFRSMRFLDLSPDAMRMPSLPGQVVLGDRGENLSSVLQAICSLDARKRALVEWVRALTPVDVTDLKFPADHTGRILATLVEENGRETSAYSASDGTLRFLAMVAAFLGPDPARFYFFEELDTGLHPTRLHLLLDLIERQVGKGMTQVVTTTHSPPLLAFLGPRVIEAAVLAYRLPGTTAQRLRKIVDLPDVRRILAEHDIAELLRTGWLETAAEVADESARASAPKAAE